MSKRAVLYARVSSDDRGKDGRNLASQLEMCREHAQKHGWRVVAELAEDDRGAPGASFELPELSRVLELARAGDLDVLVVRELDRLSRRLAKQLIVEEELKRGGVQIEYVLGEYPDTPEGNLMKNVRAVVAEYERLKIAERADRGRRNVVKNGSIMLHGDKPPFGYRLSEDGKGLVIYEPEARVVRMIYTWYVEGDEDGDRLTSRPIAARLTEMGVLTWADVHGGFKKRARGEWAWRNVINILKSETYVGSWHYGRRNAATGEIHPRETWLTLEVPAIVNRELWKKAQEQRKANTTRARRNVKREYLVRRRIRCGACGSGVCGFSSTVRGKTYQYYRCNAYMGNVANTACDLPSFRVDQVDAVVWKWVKSLLSDPEEMTQGLKAYQEQWERENAPMRERLAVIDDLLERNQTQLERLLDLYLSGDFPKEVLTDRKSHLEGVVQALEEERRGLTSYLEAQTLTMEQIRGLRDLAAEVSQGLRAADEDFQVRLKIIEMLDVRASVVVESGEKVVYVRCIIGEEGLQVASTIPRNAAPASDRPPRSGESLHLSGRTSRPGPSLLASGSPSPEPRCCRS